jgi:hypothetical protein
MEQALSKTIEGAMVAPGVSVEDAELSIGFSTEELVVLGRALDIPLGFLGSSPLAAIAPSARDDVLASAARSLRARNVLGGPADLPTVDRAVAGLVQISGRPALRAELVGDGGARLHRRYLSIPYASVQHEVDADGLHRLTPFATSDLLARAMRHAGFVERPVPAAAGFEVPYGAYAAARTAVACGDQAAAHAILVEAEAPAGSAAGLIAALGAGNPVYALRLVHATSPTSSSGGEIAWTDGGDAGLWQLPTIDQPFAAVGSGRDDDGDDRDAGLAEAPVRIEPIAASDLATFLFELLPTQPG